MTDQVVEQVVETVDIEFINVPSGHRSSALADVDRLASSISKIGLRTPISVRYRATDDSYVLVAGGHRLAAVKKLGWQKIQCFVIDGGDEDQTRLWEIAENLHRAELTTLERDENIAEWIKITERVSVQSAPKPQGGRPEGGISAAARDLGVDETDAKRAVKVATLSDRAKDAARRAGLDNNRTALLQAAKEPTAKKQVRVVRTLAQQKMDSSIRSSIKERATREIAAIIFENVPTALLPAIKANLAVCGPPAAIVKAIEAREAKAKK